MAPIDVPLSFTSDERTYGGLPSQFLKNRFFEENPTQVKGAAMLARPGTNAVATYGEGPIRSNFSQPGLFDGALFTASGDALFRRDTDGTVTPITGTLAGSGEVSMDGLSGAGFERLFVADGTTLRFYPGPSPATGTLTATGNVAVGDDVEIGGTWFEWTDTIADGSGTFADPWLVARGATAEESLENLVAALNLTGVSGTTYSSNLAAANTDVTAEMSGADKVVVESREKTVAADSITTSAASTVLSWGDSTLLGGGQHTLTSVPVPDSLPPVAVATLKGHILVAIRDSDRFYWVRPGEVTINGLDFATAESQPDDTLTVKVVGDTAFFIGRGSTEVWFATGDQDTPFAPVTGRVFDQGAADGTAVDVKGNIFLVGDDNVVYGISGGARRVSNHGVEQMIRAALEATGGVFQRSWTFDFDGHTFYVLDLDDQGSLVYDLLTGQWSRFVTEGFGGRWNLRNGFHWRDGRMVVGGGAEGDLLRLDPMLFTDIGINPGTSFLLLEGASFGDGDLLLLEGSAFESPDALLIDGFGSAVEYEVRGLLAVGGTDFRRQYSLRVIGSAGVLGDDEAPAMTMQFSDDRGETWSADYTVALTQNTLQRIEFRSLGAFTAPGRIFRIRDTGGIQFLATVEADIGGTSGQLPA